MAAFLSTACSILPQPGRRSSRYMADCMTISSLDGGASSSCSIQSEKFAVSVHNNCINTQATQVVHDRTSWNRSKSIIAPPVDLRAAERREICR